MLKRVVAVLLSLGLLACDGQDAGSQPAPAPAASESPAPPESPAPGSPGQLAVAAAIDLDDPSSCRACHAQVYQEWTESMHSRAHHESDPIYGAMRALRMKKQGEQIAAKCAKCHNPRSPEDPDAPAGRVGVSCAACHNVKAVHIEPGRAGVEALSWEEGRALRSARDLQPGVSPAHGTGPALPAMADGVTLCLACHNNHLTPAGAPACTTGDEYREAGSDQTCVSCHMPTVKGPVGAFGRQEEHSSHQFLGPHRAWYQDDPSILAASVELSAAFREGPGDGDGDGEGDGEGRLEVTLNNVSAHSFPSGFPGRTAIVKVVGRDARGMQVWTNFETNPLVEAPDSVLNKVFHDAQGRPAPAPFAKTLARDTRLGPNERRTLRYAVPPTVVTATATVLYRLLPTPLARKFGLGDEDEAQPRTVRSVEVRR